MGMRNYRIFNGVTLFVHGGGCIHQLRPPPLFPELEIDADLQESDAMSNANAVRLARSTQQQMSGGNAIVCFESRENSRAGRFFEIF
jgi:hypothetical protein